MARAINKVDFTGFLSFDPELKYTPSGKAVTKLRIGVPEEYKDQRTGEKVTTWTNFDITFWDRAAEIVCEYGKAKSEIMVHNARLKTSTWEKDGVKHEKLELVGGDFRFLTRPAGGDTQPKATSQRHDVAKPSAAPSSEPDNEYSGFSQEDIPF